MGKCGGRAARSRSRPAQRCSTNCKSTWSCAAIDPIPPRSPPPIRASEAQNAVPPTIGAGPDRAPPSRASLSPAERPGRADIGPVVIRPVRAVVVRPVIAVAIPVMVRPVMIADPPVAIEPAARLGLLRPEHRRDDQSGEHDPDLLHG